MLKSTQARHLDIYSEFCPASSVAIIGTGLVTVTLGASMAAGVAIVLAGFVVGAFGPLGKTFSQRILAKKVANRSRY